jgi:hypothetical protein
VKGIQNKNSQYNKLRSNEEVKNERRKKVSSLERKTVRHGADSTSDGKEFDRLDAVTWNNRRPKMDRR